MGKPAARLSDMHMCPMQTPAVVPIPHVGGPIAGPGAPNVLIGGLPAAVMGDMCVCVGPPDVIVMGSTGVMIGGKPAARMGDPTAHGGSIMIGCPTVLIGEASAGGGGGAGGVTAPGMLNKLGADAAAGLKNKEALKAAAKNSDDKAERSDKENFKADFSLVDEAGKGIKNVKYEIETSDGKKHNGSTDSSGKTETISGYTTADCRTTFFKK